tara:strand:- start:120 stop:452 length:333 start_codon:yes stop_codon:yes gene_type:complete
MSNPFPQVNSTDYLDLMDDRRSMNLLVPTFASGNEKTIRQSKYIKTAKGMIEKISIKANSFSENISKRAIPERANRTIMDMPIVDTITGKRKTGAFNPSLDRPWVFFHAR